MNSYTCLNCNKNLMGQFVISCKILCLDCFEDRLGMKFCLGVKNPCNFVL